MSLTLSEDKEEPKKKSTWKPAYTAQYSMGELDYMRYDALLKLADEMTIIIKCRSTPEARSEAYHIVEPYYSVLYTLYLNWRALIRDLKKFDELFDKIDKSMNDWRKQTGTKQFPNTLADSLVNIYKELLNIKQLIGLGINVRKEEKFTTKARRALLGNL